MTTLTETQDPQAREAELVAWAATFGPVLAEHAARHDAEGSWIQESFETLRDAGFLALAVPEELGGMGASIRQTALVMRELAHHCGSTALALSMHQHVTNFTAWRYRRELPGAEATLRRIADDRIVHRVDRGRRLRRALAAKPFGSTAATRSAGARSSPANRRWAR